MTADQEIVPRWEWRTFGREFGRAEAAFAALTPTGVQESDELYLVTEAESKANVKVRADLMDVKRLVAVDGDGLQQWRPIMKAGFPLPAEQVADVFAALELPVPELARSAYTLDQFVAEIALQAGFRPVNVHKRRVRYVVGGCTSEVTDVVADGLATRTIAIESNDAAAVVAAIDSVGLSEYVNTDYQRGLVALLAGIPPRYAVIDAGTNSVKFHLAERAADGSWQRLVDRAELCRLGEGLDQTGRIGDEPLARTVSTIRDMVQEARSQTALAIAGVGTAVFRIAQNGSDAVEAIKSATGLEIRVISGEEESRLAYLAASLSVGLGDRSVVVFDTGGGSSQFTYGVGSNVSERFSLNVGAAKYTERFGLDAVVDAGRLQEARRQIANDLADLEARPRPEGVVGMGGAVVNMTAVSMSMADYDPDAVQGSKLEVGEIERQIGLYAARSADERRSIVGLQPKRAEVILAGALIVRTILDRLGATHMTVSDRGLRHGLLLERFGSANASPPGGPAQ